MKLLNDGADDAAVMVVMVVVKKGSRRYFEAFCSVWATQSDQPQLPAPSYCSDAHRVKCSVHVTAFREQNFDFLLFTEVVVLVLGYL